MNSSLLKHTVNTLFFVCILIVNSFAQQTETPEPKGLNNWYIELGGSALFYSFNYEKVLYTSDKWGWVGRVGLGYTPATYTFLNTITLDRATVMAPFHSSVLFGPNKEKVEIGVGFTLLAKSATEQETLPTGVLGFRVVENNKVCFRVCWTPFIRSGEFVSWFGVSLGRNFSVGKRK